MASWHSCVSEPTVAVGGGLRLQGRAALFWRRDELTGKHIMRITSTGNDRVKHVVRLRNRRARDRAGEIVIEGYRPLWRALESNYPVRDLYICPDWFQGENEPALVDRFVSRGTVVIEVASEAFCKMAYRDRPEGLLGVGPQVRQGLDDIPRSANPLLLVAEAIEKPGNLGTILRSADAVAADAVIVCDEKTDLFNPNVVRASIGTLFTVPVVVGDSAATQAWLRARGVRIVATTPHTDTVFTEIDLSQPAALVVGTEQYGLSPTWLAAADDKVRIPMLGSADSLNVATATTLLLYEAVRQRGTGKERSIESKT